MAVQCSCSLTISSLAWQVSEAGTYATCKEVPVPQHCLMYSFMVRYGGPFRPRPPAWSPAALTQSMPRSGSGLQLDVETHFARHKSCVVHYFNQVCPRLVSIFK
jgi:hypothetical protein